MKKSPPAQTSDGSALKWLFKTFSFFSQPFPQKPALNIGIEQLICLFVCITAIPLALPELNWERIKVVHSKEVPGTMALSLIFGLWFIMPPHSQQSNYIRNAYKWCAVIRVARKHPTELNGTSAMDLGFALPRWTHECFFEVECCFEVVYVYEVVYVHICRGLRVCWGLRKCNYC